jgi:hypothetical protein
MNFRLQACKISKTEIFGNPRNLVEKFVGRFEKHVTLAEPDDHTHALRNRLLPKGTSSHAYEDANALEMRSRSRSNPYRTKTEKFSRIDTIKQPT